MFTTLLDRRYDIDAHKKIGIHTDRERKNLREMIREIAFAIFKSNREYIHKRELLRLPTVQSAEFPLKDSLKNLMISFYFREIEKEEGNWEEEQQSNFAVEFLHKSLQEYMAAEYLWHTILIEFTSYISSTKRYAIDNWQGALQKAFSLFSQRPLSKEIAAYLMEIISFASKEEKLVLASRLKYFLPTLLRGYPENALFCILIDSLSGV